MLLTATAFFFISIIYSIVGLGGGSSYSAILAIADVPYLQIPVISLFCNLVVVIINLWSQKDYQKIPWPIATSLLLGSIPFSFLGGMIKVSQQEFFLVLAITLILSSIKMIFYKNPTIYPTMKKSKLLLITIGIFLGLLAGLTGIGGGIFLAPFLYFFRIAKPLEVIALTSFFIFINSCFGLFGQLLKSTSVLTNFYFIFPYLIAVILGAFVSNFILRKKVKIQWIEPLTGCLILIIACKILISNL